MQWVMMEHRGNTTEMMKYWGGSYPKTAAAAKSFQVVSDSVWPHRQQPTRFPRPWDSPGKNTGVGCHFLLQCMKVKSESEVAQPCSTLSDPMDCSLPGSSIQGNFQARTGQKWMAIHVKSEPMDGVVIEGQGMFNTVWKQSLEKLLEWWVVTNLPSFLRSPGNKMESVRWISWKTNMKKNKMFWTTWNWC